MAASIRGSCAFTLLTISSVEAWPLRRIVSNAPRDVLLDRESVAHGSYVSQVNRGPVHRLDGQIIQIAEDLGTAVDPHRILGVANLDGAGRYDQVLLTECARDVDRR